MPNTSAEQFDDLRRQTHKTARAESIKERVREPWTCDSVEAAKEHFQDQYR